MYTITVSEKGGQQSTFEFNKPEVTIGRMKGNDIVLPKGNVSKRHSRIFAQEGAFSIMDLDSTNGTYVNGRRIQGEQDVSGADKIYIGDFILQIETELNAPPPPPNGSAAPLPPGPPAPPPEPWAAEGSSNDAASSAGTGVNPVEPKPLPVEEVVNQNASPFDPGSNGFADSLPPTPDFDKPAEPVQFAPPEPAVDALSAPTPSNDYLPPEPSNVPPPQPLLDANPAPSVQLNVSAAVQQKELNSEFDQDFYTAQIDVTHVLFEKLDLESLPAEYPPQNGELERYKSSVESAVNTVNPAAERETLIDLIAAECVGLGPLESYLDDPEIDAIYVHRHDQVMVRRRGELVRAKHCFSNPDFLKLAAQRLAPNEEDGPHREVRFADGTKINISLPPLTPNPIFTIQKPNTFKASLDDLVAKGVLSQSMSGFLRNAVLAGRSIVVAGPTSSGKSTVLSALASEIGDGARVAAVERYPALTLPEFAMRFEINADVNPTQAIHAALSTNPHRLVLDDCQGREAYDWATAAACGTDGSMVSINGLNSRNALGRLEALAMLGAGDGTPTGIREQIARSVDIVVLVNRTIEGFRVQQISDVQGVDLDTYRMHDVFYYRMEGGAGSFHPTGHVPSFYEDLRHSGIDVDFGVFRE